MLPIIFKLLHIIINTNIASYIGTYIASLRNHLIGFTVIIDESSKIFEQES